MGEDHWVLSVPEKYILRKKYSISLQKCDITGIYCYAFIINCSLFYLCWYTSCKIQNALCKIENVIHVLAEHYLCSLGWLNHRLQWVKLKMSTDFCLVYLSASSHLKDWGRKRPGSGRFCTWVLYNPC